MGHTRTLQAKSQWSRELALGARMRRLAEAKFIIAGARTNNTAPNAAKATVIPSETVVVPIMIAPCAGKVERLSFIAQVVPVGGTLSMTVKKAVIGAADVNLSTALSPEQTNDTAEDFVLSTVAGALEFDEGQLIFVSIAADAAAITTRSHGAMVQLEWRPTEK
jgi:hypothetical protein